MPIRQLGEGDTVTYIASFFGREVGAIGATYIVSTVVSAGNEYQARLALYDRFEHIQALTLTGQPERERGDHA